MVVLDSDSFYHVVRILSF